MIHRMHDQIFFSCDSCPESLECATEDFGEAMGEFRREGWKAERIGSDWIHLCPTCREEA